MQNLDEQLYLSSCTYRDIFYEAEKHIFELMKKNSYPRFIQSEHYRTLLQNAPNPLPKKTYVEQKSKKAFFETIEYNRIWSFWFSGILHFVKDNYFRTLSSSSDDDEYDSDDSVGKNENTTATTKTSNPAGPLLNTAGAQSVFAGANTAPSTLCASDSQK